MAARITSWRSWPSLLGGLVSQARLAVRLLREPVVPLLTKALPVLGAVYVVSPLDFLPDVLPILGEVDDLAVMMIAVSVFLHMCPTGAVRFHRTAITQGHKYSPMPSTGEVIDAEFRREE